MRCRFSSAVVFFHFAVIPAVVSAQPIGMILQINGKAGLERASEAKGLRLGDLLLAGDRLSVESGEITFLFCPTRQRVTVGSGSVVELAADGIRVEGGPSPVQQATRGCVLPRVALGSESLERVGGLRARGKAPIAILIGGAISSSTPTFTWEPVEEAQRYVVQISTDMGKKLFEKSTTGTVLAFPDPARPLARGFYRWHVQAEKDGEVVAEQAVNFEVKPIAETLQPAGESEAEMLEAAVALENDGYYAEAAHYYRKLRGSSDDLRLTRRLAWLYWNAGLLIAFSREQEKLNAAALPE